jgi:hypothetical protein
VKIDHALEENVITLENLLVACRFSGVFEEGFEGQEVQKVACVQSNIDARD